jgi:hypothetical protein
MLLLRGVCPDPASFASMSAPDFNAFLMRCIESCVTAWNMSSPWAGGAIAPRAAITTSTHPFISKFDL